MENDAADLARKSDEGRQWQMKIHYQNIPFDKYQEEAYSYCAGVDACRKTAMRLEWILLKLQDLVVR